MVIRESLAAYLPQTRDNSSSDRRAAYRHKYVCGALALITAKTRIDSSMYEFSGDNFYQALVRIGYSRPNVFLNS